MATTNDETLQRVELALAQAKRVQRESRLVVRSLAGLRDELAEEAKADEETADPSVK